MVNELYRPPTDTEEPESSQPWAVEVSGLCPLLGHYMRPFDGMFQPCWAIAVHEEQGAPLLMTSSLYP